MNIGVLFSGQGAQYPGMGKSLYEHSAAARRVLDEAGAEVKAQCFEAAAEELKQTAITQPCVYAVGMAAYAAFLEALSAQGLMVPHVEQAPEQPKGSSGESQLVLAGVAGFSLGEYAALTAAGIIGDVPKGVALVRERGRLMQAAGTSKTGEAKGGMMAAMGQRESILTYVESARGDGILEAVNFNAPGQTVVAGDFAALGRFAEVAKRNRIKAMRLPVSAAFHSPMMAPAAEPLRQLLLDATLSAPTLKCYCNVTGQDLFAGNAIPAEGLAAYVADMMARQVKSPVYWQETIENMMRDGIQAVVECGPGKALRGLAKKIAPDLPAFYVEDAESLQETIEALNEMLPRA